MGLGTILRVDERTVQVVFLATGETRTYARVGAPLSRVRFSNHDTIRSQEGWSMQIEHVEEQEGLLFYFGRRDDGSEAVLPESRLDNLMQLNQPADRLLTGQLDKPKLFTLRRETRQHLNRLLHSDLYGLIGTRTNLIPHQLYIADEVSKRHAPRVLLADEVGLGKTIEAGLILHRQLLTERAQRVLIVVPETLVHQWLIEMLRRFNLLFSIFDEPRCIALQEGDTEANPFDSEQLILCSLSFLTTHADRLQAAANTDWDLLVVDEAHHLQWSPQEASTEYQCIEKLANTSKGILLLTATPEQLGKTGHFARLRLLDPDRFPDFDQFVEEETHYAPIAAAVEDLMNDAPLSQASIDVLTATFAEGDNQGYLEQVISTHTSQADKDYARNRLIEHLLDRHGTGRVLFRNTRHAIKGFPGRSLLAYPLNLPADYAASLPSVPDTNGDVPHLLCPERGYETQRQPTQPAWTELDPRVPWLADKLRELKPAKVLVITATSQTALDLSDHLQQRVGIYAAVFHEEMSMVERDRAAAFFADPEQGTQILICSEIGSEGRNFQFSHHLVLFDLPLNPDLLEQRIGRLDRIGQTRTIQIHVPYLQDTAQQVLFEWYHHGLGAFEKICPAGHSVYLQVEPALTAILHKDHQDSAVQSELKQLIEKTRHLHDEFNQVLQQGRDRLLEYSSCRTEKATALVDRAIEQSNEKQLANYMDSVFDNFGIESELHSSTSFVITPGDHVRLHLPGLDEDGMTITYHRTTAMANEDMEFISWEHPLVTAAMDSIVSSETGNTTMVTIKHAGLQPGQVFVECLYNLVPTSGRHQDIGRYFTNSTIRVVLDQEGKQYQSSLTHELIEQRQERIKPEVAARIIKSHSRVLKGMLASCDKLVNQYVPSVVVKAQQLAETEFKREIDRLVALRTVNPNIRDDEIQFFRQQQRAVLDKLSASVAQLDAVRVMIAVN